MTIINKSLDWIRNHFDKDKVNKFSIVVIMIYYYVGLLSYITVPIKPVYRLFTSGSSVAVVIRALMTAMIVLYCLLVVIVNKEKVQWKWAVVFIYILLFTLLSTAISPQTYNYIYVSKTNYHVVYWIQASTGFNRLFTMYLSSISDFALAFCFLFIFPIVINNKKQVLLLTIPIVFIGLFECGYSIIKERGEYAKLINMIDPQYGGYNVSIGATFGNKEDWGSFLSVAFCSGLVSLFLLEGRKYIRIFTSAFLIISLLIFFSFSIMSLCKTAIGAQTICLVFLSFCFVYVAFKKNRILFIIYLVFALLVYGLIIIFFAVPKFHESGLLSKIYNVVNSYIISPITGGAAGERTDIWIRLVDNMRTYNLFFGLSKGGVSTYSQVITVEGQSALHNGLVYFFASYGIFGFSIYLFLLMIVVARIIKLMSYNVNIAFVSFGILLVAFVFSLSEAEVLVVSGSIPSFIFNILICCFVGGLLKKESCNINKMEYPCYA